MSEITNEKGWYQNFHQILALAIDESLRNMYKKASDKNSFGNILILSFLHH